MILSLDLGSRRVGVVGAVPVLPLRVEPDRHVTLAVDPADIGLAVAHLAALLSTGSIAGVVVEHGALYMPPGKTPQGYREIGAAHEVCSRLHERIGVLCANAGIPMVTISRQSWAHRVVPRTRGGITDAMANAGLAAHVEPGTVDAMGDQDQRDALGAIVGWLLGPPKIERRSRAKGPPRALLSPEQRRANRRKLAALWVAKVSRERAETRVAKGCNCRPPGTRGRHPRTCPAAPPPRTRGSAAAAAAYQPITR